MDVLTRHSPETHVKEDLAKAISIVEKYPQNFTQEQFETYVLVVLYNINPFVKDLYDMPNIMKSM